MGIPEEIRKVPRPKGTVVVKSGSGYRVRKRNGSRYVDGKHIPIDGGYIGSIIDMRYVPDPPEDPSPWTGSTGRVDVKLYGRVKLCDMLNEDIIRTLATYYNREEAMMIYVIAILRANYAGIRDYQLQSKYEETFLSIMYPGIKLGRTKVSREIRNLGKEKSRIDGFMRGRVCCIDGDDLAIIDGCLMQDHSYIDTLSQVSKETVHTKYKQFLLMYAYSFELNEPLCCRQYQGNMVDSRAVKDFIEKNDIVQGIIVADKGFSVGAVLEAIEGLPGLHFLLPLKRDSSLIHEYSMYSYTGVLNDERHISYKKIFTGEYWLYSFRDPKIAADEEGNYLDEHVNNIDIEELSRKRAEFGTIVFQSDLEMPASKAYSIYESRWLIELLFKFHQTTLDIDDTRVNDFYSVMGTEFINFLATLMASRMKNHFDSVRELDHLTYKASLDQLEKAKKVRIYDSDEWEDNRLPQVDADLLVKMGLYTRPIIPEEKKRMGRKPGSKDTKPRKPRSDKGIPRKKKSD